MSCIRYNPNLRINIVIPSTHVPIIRLISSGTIIIIITTVTITTTMTIIIKITIAITITTITTTVIIANVLS